MTDTIADLLTDYRAILEERGELTPEDKELIMNLSAVYLKQRESWKLEGHKEGHKEGNEEALDRVAIALLHEGMSIELISKTTGLSRDHLQILQARLK